MKRKFAVFDIDGTLFRSSLLVELVEALIQEGVFPNNARNTYRRAYERWSERKGEYDSYVYAVARTYQKHIRGVRYADFLQVVDQVATFHKDILYRYTRNLLQELKRKKYYCVAISRSPQEIVDAFARHLGFNAIDGLAVELDRSRTFFLGTAHDDIHKNVERKDIILKRIIEEKNLTLVRSVGVGDTEADIDFLEMVSDPICFNPNKKLYDHAMKRNWKVIVERKDVIYELQRGRLAPPSLRRRGVQAKRKRK